MQVLRARQDIRFPLAQVGIAMEKTYDALPYFITTVDMAQYEALLKLESVIDVSLDNPNHQLQNDEILRPTLTSSINRVNVRAVWDMGITGEGQVVAVLDSGLDTGHPAFKNKVVAEACFSPTHTTFSRSLCGSGREEATGPRSASRGCNGIGPIGESEEICA